MLNVLNNAELMLDLSCYSCVHLLSIAADITYLLPHHLTSPAFGHVLK